MSAQSPRIEEIRQQLESICDELTDMAIDMLSEASAAGEERPPELERRITRARRAIEKAAVLLAGPDDG